MIEKGTSGLKTADRFHRQRNQPACVPALRPDRRRNCSCGRKIIWKMKFYYTQMKLVK